MFWRSTQNSPLLPGGLELIFIEGTKLRGTNLFQYTIHLAKLPKQNWIFHPRRNVLTQVDMESYTPEN